METLRDLGDEYHGRFAALAPYRDGAYWDFWDHYLPLTDRSMVEGLKLAGFSVERVEPRFLPYSMSQGFTPPVVLISLYLRFPLLWRVFGKQFLVVARKPSAEGLKGRP